MDKITKKTLETKRGYTYTYYVSPAAEGKTTLLLQHGFPDEAAEWEGLINNHLAPHGYGVIAPDMLGYAGTSKPLDPAAYKMRGVMADLREIVEAEGVAKVISLGHDWGSSAAQYFYNLNPDITEGLVMVNVPYSGLQGGTFDLDKVLEQTEKVFGMGLFWYWKLFTAPDGAALMNRNVDLVFTQAHSKGTETWPGTMCTKDGYRKFLEEGKPFDVEPYAKAPGFRERFVERLQRDGFDAPVCWYKSAVENLQGDQADTANRTVNVPALFVGYDGDVVCRKEMIQGPIDAGLLPHITVETLEGYHWGLLAEPKKFGDTVVGWLEKTYPVKG